MLSVFTLLMGCTDFPYASEIGTKGEVEIVPGQEFYIVVVFEIRGGGEAFKKDPLILSLTSSDEGLRVMTPEVSVSPPFSERREVRFKCCLDKGSKKDVIKFFAKVRMPDESVITKLDFSRLVTHQK